MIPAENNAKHFWSVNHSTKTIHHHHHHYHYHHQLETVIGKNLTTNLTLKVILNYLWQSLLKTWGIAKLSNLAKEKSSIQYNNKISFQLLPTIHPAIRQHNIKIPMI